jgi:hypothetical protein
MYEMIKRLVRPVRFTGWKTTLGLGVDERIILKFMLKNI